VNKKRVRLLGLAILSLVVIWILAGRSLPARAENGSPEEMVQRAWRNAQEAGSYRFISDIDQTMIPRASPEMIGQQETELDLALDGAVVLPDQAYSELWLASGNRSDSVTVLRDGGQSFMLQDGTLKPVEEALNLASQTDDMLGYLAGAEQVTLLDPPEGHPELVRYGFEVSGPRYAEYVRQQAEAQLRAEPGAPEGLTIEPLPALQTLNGQGELWVNQAGLPVRQVLEIAMPEVTAQYSARIQMRVDLSGYGQVEALPRAVPGADGTWRLEGALPTGMGSNLGAFSGFGAPSNPPTAAPASARVPSRLPLRIPPTDVGLLILIVLAILIVRYYRRNSRRCYVLVVLILIPIMLLSTLLRSEHVGRFQERQAQAAEARAASAPEMLGALGLETSVTTTTSAGGTTAKAAATHSLTLPATSTGMMQAPANDGALLRCGEGEPGVDTDGDGLLDTVELCLGTSPDSADTDGDSIPDDVEIHGFDLGGKHWDSDPLKPDSNGDGMLDTFEWSTTHAENGRAEAADLDGDGIPNLWDDDDDGDGVPDAHDLSAFARSDYTSSLTLSTAGSGFSGYQYIEIQVQPQDLEHLRYTTTALDWPDYDEQGNIQDLDDSTADVRLSPFLLVNTNVQPAAELAEKYGFRSWASDGQYVLLVPMLSVENGGAIHAFYGKVAYAPGQTGAIQWEAKLVWMTQMQADYWAYRPLTMGEAGWDMFLENMTAEMKTETRVVHQYQDDFRLTGLQVTKDKGYEAAVIGTPVQATPATADDLNLFRLLLGLRQVFKGNLRLEGQAANETALQEIAQRFAPNSTADLDHTFGVTPSLVAMAGPKRYGHLDAGLAGVGSELVPGYLSEYDTYYGQVYRCRDAEGNGVHCAALVIAYEQSLGVRGLDELPLTDGLITADLAGLHVNLADVPLLQTRGVQMRMYEQGANGTWQIVTPARMLEFVEQRYKGVYADGLRDLYPGLEAEDLRLIGYTAYLWAIAPSYTLIAADGRSLVPELADEAQLAIERALAPELEAEVETVIDYVGLGTDLAWAFEGFPAVLWAGQDFWRVWAKGHLKTGLENGWAITGAVLMMSGIIASTVIGIISAVCDAGDDSPMCRNEEALEWANVGVEVLNIVAQAQYVADLIKEIATKASCSLTKIAIGVQVAGMVIGVATNWVFFGLTVAGSWGDPVVWRVALAAAIVTTVWYIVLFAINFIPVIGTFIAAVLALFDMILGFIFGLLGLDEFGSIATLILGLFYSADYVTTLETVEFGEFESGLEDPDGGLVGGNTFILSAPASGIIKKEEGGKDSDLDRSWVKGVLATEPSSNIFDAQEISEPPDCHISHGKLYCSNTPAVGYVLTPAVNGAASLVAKFLYATVWAEWMVWGAARVNSHVAEAQAPEEDGEPTLVYLDVLPGTLTELWHWSELGNPDNDGDGLADDAEPALGTSTTEWDTDGDGLSDYYEWQNADRLGTDPLQNDTDGDGLDDGLERRLGTRIDVADTDGDGLSDGEEVRRYEGGIMVGGWQVTLPDGSTDWVGYDPLAADADGDGLNDAEEKANGLSPHATNDPVPMLSLGATPIRGLVGGRAGTYWQPGEAISFTIALANWAKGPVTTPLSLALPGWIDNLAGGVMQGDRTIAMVQEGNTLSWPFSAANPLQRYEEISTTVTARVNPATASASDAIDLTLLFGDVQMRKTLSAVVDGDDPNVAIVAPADGAYLRGAHYVVGGSTTDPTTWITARSLSIVSQGREPSFQDLPVRQGPWAYTWELPADGVYSLQARATDALGHATTTASVNVTVDNTAPVASLTSQMVDGTVHLSGTATDNLSGIEWMQISIDQQPWRSVSVDGSAWSYDWAVGVTAQGEHTVRARAIDRCGNESALVGAEIVVDSVAPASTVNSGAGPDIPPAVQANTAFNLTGVADEGGHLLPPAVPADLRTGMDVFDDGTVWLGLSTIHANDGGVLAAWIGDFNADRLSDLAVGLPGPEGDAGLVAVLYGRAGGWPARPDLQMLATSPMRFTGVAGARLGSLVAAAGDANGDNLDDLLIGERAATRAFLVFGNPRPLGGIALDAGQSAYRVMLQAPATITSLAAAGDVNADNMDDLLVVAGGTAYLVAGRHGPWPETLDVATEAVATFDGVTGALGVGDVDNDQLDEWVTLAGGAITLYAWNADTGATETVSTFTTADADPRAAALGDVDGDGYADWLYANGTSRILVYGSGATHTFSNYGGFFVAPGDVDGDGRPDMLLANATGTASLIRQQVGESSPEVFASVAGVGGAASAPYAAGADLNSDGSAELLLIPSREAAEAHGFDAPDFSSGFVSPQELPLGVSSPVAEESTTELAAAAAWPPSEYTMSLALMDVELRSAGADTRYVDDDAVNGTCEGNSPCFTTIQAAVNASDGGGDTIIVCPGAYPSFSVPAGSNYDNLTVQGVSADAVFVDGAAGPHAISVAADGVRLSNLTVRNATSGVALQDGAGELPLDSSGVTAIDHLVAHSLQYPIQVSQSAVLSLTHSTLVGNGTDPMVRLNPTPDPAAHTWNNDRAIMSGGALAPLSTNGGLASTASTLYAMPGGTNRTVYAATPGTDGALGAWSAAFQMPHAMPTGAGQSVIAAGGNHFFQMHATFKEPDLGTITGKINAVAVAPNGDVYVGGSFTSIGGQPILNVARWNGTQWQPLGQAGLNANGVSGPVYALTIVSNGDVYVGGSFATAYLSSAQSVTVRNIVRWNGSQWLPLLGTAYLGGNDQTGVGTNGPVYALAHTADDYVLVGGHFDYYFIEPTWSWLRNFMFWAPTMNWYYPTKEAYGNGIYGGGETVRSIVWTGGNYADGTALVGGDFEYADRAEVSHVAFFHYNPSGGFHWSSSPPSWVAHPMPYPVSDLARDATTGKVYAVSTHADSAGAYMLDPSLPWEDPLWRGWRPVAGVSGQGAALFADASGDVYAGMAGGLYLLPAGGTAFELLGSETAMTWDLVPDNAGSLLAGYGGDAVTGGVRRWALAGLLRRDLSSGTWELIPYPAGIGATQTPVIGADDAGNLYAAWNEVSDDRSVQRAHFYTLAAGSTTWQARVTNITNLHIFRKLVWSGSHLYALSGYYAWAGPYTGYNENTFFDIYRYDPATEQWSQNAVDRINWYAIGSSDAVNLVSAVGDDAGHLFTLAPSSWVLSRYDEASDWVALTKPTILDTSQPSGMARVGNYLYAYATPASGVTTNIFRYGTIGLEQRLQASGNAFVLPDTATSTGWASPNTYAFEMQFVADNAWVGPDGTSWSPALPAGATALTAAQAGFVAPEDGLYRLGSGSQLTAGYHQYKAVAHVYPSQAACSECAGGGLVWGETAFATVRAAVESGAARVLVHPGRYPQSFYLVSGVEVVGSGAELTVIEPPAGSAATLVTAEGVAGASLARVTLAGGGLWNGFLAEGGATGLKLTRSILRDLSTGVQLRGGSEVEVINNTLVRNTNGLVAEGTNPVNVRNSIFAHHTGTGLRYGTSPTSLSNTYNDFWANGTDMARDGGQPEPSLGSLFVDPRFHNLAGNDLRLQEGSPVIDAGAPNDPTTPGGGARVDMGYAEYNAAGFYVSQNYSETGLNDGLTWGIDAFDEIQPALDAAAAALHGLQGALPAGGYSVGVDTGTYTETVSVPSHVRLVGSGAEVTILDAGAAGSAATFDGVIDAELSGFTLQNASSSGAGVALANAASGITLSRNVIRNNAGHGVSLAGSSSAAIRFNTITGNAGAGVYASGAGTWADVRNNILNGNAAGLQAASNGLIRNAYNLLHNTTALSGVTAGDGTLTTAPAFGSGSYYVPSAASPAIDAAEPWAVVPLAGGLRADLGYKELIASPLTLVFGPQIDSTVTGNSGVARVEVGVVLVSDATKPVTATLPATWTTLTPAQTGQPLFYWSQSVSQADPGLYRVYSRATDAAGNVETDELDWYEGAFVVDNTAPVVTWVATPPASTDVAGVFAVVEVAGTVSTGTGTRDDVAQVAFSVTGTAMGNYPGEKDGNVFRAWIPLPATGSYTINAVAIDEAGNQASQSATVEVSATGSVATVMDPPSGGGIAGTAVTLRGYVRFTSAGTGQVDVTVDTTTVQAALETPSAQFSAWSAAITLPAGEGTKTVTVTPSLDGAAGTPTTLNLTLDTTAPALSITAPAAGTTVTQTVALAGTASDAGSGLARVEVSFDGGYTWRQAALSADAWSLDWELAGRQDYVSYRARVRAVDAAGNVTVVERRVAVDGVPPTDLVPVTFGEPEGQHLDTGTSLSIAWNAPVDAGGAVQVLLAVDRQADTLPAAVANGTSNSATLDAVGDWYAHLVAQDAAGNQAVYHYGPWHVRDTANATFSARRQSIMLDGFLDLAHDEWQAAELLGVDARSGNPQALYMSWDGQHVFLGWSGAWWTLDGVLWAYLDMEAGGSNTGIDGRSLPVDLYADRAVEIRAAGDGSLWTWNGGDWAEGTLEFANGPSGDTELRVPWTYGAGLRAVAFALPREAEMVQSVQTLAVAGGETLALARAQRLDARGGETLALTEGEVLLQAPPALTPWVVFPTTNGLAEDLSAAFTWSDIPAVGQINAGQPAARTVLMEVSSPQASGAAACAVSDITYDIMLHSREPGEMSGLTLALAATSGLTYQSVEGASLVNGAPGDASWTLGVPTLAAGASAHVRVTARTAADVSGLEEVTSTITLAAGTTLFTTESNTVATAVHRVDTQAPTLRIDTLGGAAIAAGAHTFTGFAGDGGGSGVARVEVSSDGGATWQMVTGTLAWSAVQNIPDGASFSLQARAVDGCGRESAVATQTFNVDSTPPAVFWALPDAITAPLATLSGTTSDPAPAGSLVKTVEVQRDSEAAAWRRAAGPFAPQDGAQSWTWSWITPQEDGVTHQLRVRATDQAGNTSVTAWQSTLVDTIAPQITVTEQVTSTALTNGPAAQPILAGTVSDGSGVQTVRLLVYDSLGYAASADATLADGSWTYSPDLSGWGIGAYALRIQAVDVHGNLRTQGPYHLAVLDAPVAGLAATNDGPRMIGEPLTFTATITAGTSVTYTWAFGDGATALGQVATHAYTVSGEYTATVTASNSVSTMEATTPVTILALSLQAGPDQTADEGATVPITATFTDGREDVTHTATIDWGDGTSPEAGVVDEAALTISGSHVYADDGVYTVTVTVDDGQGHTASDSLQVTVSNVAPTATLTNDGPKGEAVAVTVAFTGVHDAGTADTFTYSFDWDNDGTFEVVDQSTGSAQHTWPDNGAYTVRGRVQDDDGSYTDYTTQVTVTNVAPAVMAELVSQTVAYSEALAEITFTATDVPTDTMTAVLSWSSDGTTFSTDLSAAGLVLGHAVCTADAAANTCIWKVTGTVHLAVGSYTVRLAVTDKDGGVTNKDVTLVVKPEEAEVTFDTANPVAVQVATPGGASGPFTLAVCVHEEDTASPGDISLATASMSLLPVGPGGAVAGVAGTPTTSKGQLCVTFSFNAVPVNTYVVDVSVGGNYAGHNEDVLVVYDPSLGFTTGGGWFYWPGTAKPETGYPGDKTNFGFTMKYLKNGKNVQGNLLLIRHLEDGTSYRVKSNALYGLALGEDSTVPMGWASFSGKATYQEPGWPEPIGNYEFTVYVEDRNEPGSGVDRLWIEVSGGLALPRNAIDNALNIEGGNLVVPHKAR
jgi:hypothetical protein